MTTVRYWRDQELDELAQEALERWHAGKMNLAQFDFYFRDPPRMAAGKIVLGEVRRVPEMWKEVGDVNSDYAITIAAEAWDSLTREQRLAVLDHQLTHCEPWVDKKGVTRFGLSGHDLNDFIEVIRRQGIYLPDLARAREAMQLSLPGLDHGDEPEPDPLRKIGDPTNVRATGDTAKVEEFQYDVNSGEAHPLAGFDDEKWLDSITVCKKCRVINRAILMAKLKISEERADAIFKALEEMKIISGWKESDGGDGSTRDSLIYAGPPPATTGPEIVIGKDGKPRRKSRKAKPGIDRDGTVDDLVEAIPEEQKSEAKKWKEKDPDDYERAMELCISNPEVTRLMLDKVTGLTAGALTDLIDELVEDEIISQVYPGSYSYSSLVYEGEEEKKTAEESDAASRKCSCGFVTVDRKQKNCPKCHHELPPATPKPRRRGKRDAGPAGSGT